MPNGISCTYFAVRNHIYGQKEQNVFKEGIAGAQTTRALDAAAQSGILKCSVMSPISKFFGKAAAIARKIVYPLIIASGVYNTVVSDDKIRTGASQAGGIAVMYTFEQAAERGLNLLSEKLYNTNIAKNNKAAKTGIYIAKGLAFVAASLTGYNTGSKFMENAVDKLRNTKIYTRNSLSNTEPFPVDDDISADDIEETLFEDMIL